MNIKLAITQILAILVIGCAQTDKRVETGESIEVAREIVLPDKKPIHELAISQIPSNGGYVITGNVGASQAWAVRLDVQGQQQWSYTTPQDIPPEGQQVSSSWHNSHYESAMVLKDGSTILCGYKNVGEDIRPSLVGLLTRIDANGNYVNQQLLRPQSNPEFKTNYLYQCAPWNEGYFVTGIATRFLQNKRESYIWLIALDSQGKFLWEKLLPRTFSLAQKMPVIVMKNGDLILTNPAALPNDNGTGMDYFTEVMRVTGDGEIRKSRRLSGSMRLVRQPNPAQAIRLVPFHLNDSGMQLLTLKDDLSEAEKLITSKKEEFGISQAMELPDQSLVLVGNVDYANNTAAMVRFSPDLRKRQDYIFQPIHQSWRVEDGLAIGNEGEWVVIRTNHDKSATKSSYVFSFTHTVSH